MNLNKLSAEIHQNAVDHGWWKEERSVGDIITLIHSEISEALEEYRSGHALAQIYFNGKKPEGIPTELADAIIRVLDYCGKFKWDINEAIKDPFCVDFEYNKDDFADFLSICHMTLSKARECGSRMVSVYWLAGLIKEIMLFCETESINLEAAIRIKHEYNKTRPYRHGGKVI